MLPPVVEIYVVWHPADAVGDAVASEFMRHFHGNRFTGLIGGAVEVFVRFSGWRWDNDAPRPIPTQADPPPNGLQPARLTVIVPVLGLGLARAVQAGTGDWFEYVRGLTEAHAQSP